MAQTVNVKQSFNKAPVTQWRVVDGTFLVASPWTFSKIFYDAMMGGQVTRVIGRLSTGVYDYFRGQIKLCSKFLVIEIQILHAGL